MKVCIAPAYAVRAYKQIIELKKHGFTTYGTADRTTPFHSEYDLFNLYFATPSFSRLMKEVKQRGVDLVNIHHEPGWMAKIAKNEGNKVVVDVGDLDMTRTGKISQGEVEMLQCADGIVYNSEEYKKTLEKNGIKTTENEVTVYPFANKRFYQNPRTLKGGIIYQGNIFSPYNSSKFDYRNMMPLTDACEEMKIKISLFPSQFSKKRVSDYIKKYHKTFGLLYNPYPEDIPDQYVAVYNPVEYDKLIQEMSNYHWGFVGTHIEESYMNYVMPHKLFDYMASGIPIMVMNMKKTSEFVEREGVGVTIREFSDIQKYYDLWEEKQKNVLKVRDKWAMENHIDKVINVFKEAVKGGTNG